MWSSGLGLHSITNAPKSGQLPESISEGSPQLTAQGGKLEPTKTQTIDLKRDIETSPDFIDENQPSAVSNRQSAFSQQPLELSVPRCLFLGSGSESVPAPNCLGLCDTRWHYELA